MIVFDIKRYAINDGPGIRTTIFFKGCPLRCVWCHNPESWRPQPEWLFKAKKCIGCNTCGIYPNQLEVIRTMNEESSFYDCPTLALELCGKEWSVEELMEEVEKERDIMRDSGGGVTLSGGEPLRQVGPQFLHLLRELGKRGIHRAVDTTLYASADTVSAVAAEADLFLVDLKVMDPEKHRRYTGVSNECILDNLRLLARLGTPFQIRIPLIEGVNADAENIEQTAQFILSLGASSADGHSQLPTVALLPYHEMGREKHARRGTTYNPEGIELSTPSDAAIERCIQQFASHGIQAGIGG